MTQSRPGSAQLFPAGRGALLSSCSHSVLCHMAVLKRGRRCKYSHLAEKPAKAWWGGVARQCFLSGQGQKQNLNPRDGPGTSVCLSETCLHHAFALVTRRRFLPRCQGCFSSPSNHFCLHLFSPVQAASERPSLLALCSDKICLCSLCLPCTCLL